MPNSRLSEHLCSLEWLKQFDSKSDQALAAQLLNRLKLVSGREFETALEAALQKLQVARNERIAVYPICKPSPKGITGYDPFEGGTASGEAPNRHAGRRRQYGSEDRVGHLLAKLQNRSSIRGRPPDIVCNPTLNQVEAERIRHIVLVDDICGSGRRVIDYWRSVVNRRVKSLLSLKRLELWIVLYGITPFGYRKVRRELRRFPIKTNLISVIPAADLRKRIPKTLVELCRKYARKAGNPKIALGYRDSSCPIVFEHGCPNNLPGILWVTNSKWQGLFPNRAIPPELRPHFDGGGIEAAAEDLWSSNQRKLALAMLTAVAKETRLSPEDWLLLTVLGLSLRGLRATDISRRILTSQDDIEHILARAALARLYEPSSHQVTLLGREMVKKFRERYSKIPRLQPIGSQATGRYPSQCEGKFFKSGKTA